LPIMPMDEQHAPTKELSYRSGWGLLAAGMRRISL
jgi:hypothetical protein